MFYLFLGCFAFLFLYIFDFLKLKNSPRLSGVFFFLGFCLLLFSSFRIAVLGNIAFLLPMGIRVFLIILAFISFIGLLCALFFVLPFQKTYIKPEENNVVDTGLYALCRHPGVLFFAAMYLFWFLATGRTDMFFAMILWTAMDILHVYIQDKFFFSKTIKGYDRYRLTVPFLIPTRVSFKKCMADFKR